MEYRSLVRTLLLFVWVSGVISAQNVLWLKWSDEINASATYYIRSGIRYAESSGKDAIVLEMNTFGGKVDDADAIRTALLASSLPVAAYVNTNAISAGAMIVLACDSIFMAPGATFGAVTAVYPTGEAAPDKYQSVVRGIMRSTAESNGRSPVIAEKMVDEHLDLPGICPEGKVLTLTSSEAMVLGYCEGEVSGPSDVLWRMNMKDAQVEHYSPPVTGRLIQMLLHPAVSFLLLILIFGGVIWELKTPGVGLPGLVALVSAILFFAPHYVDGLAESWEILMFAAGLALVGLEIFVIPGFGVTGVSGIILTILGLSGGLLRNNGFDFSLVTTEEILQAIAIVMVTSIAAGTMSFWLISKVSESGFAGPMVEKSTLSKEEGYTVFRNPLEIWIGKEGFVITDLKPVGFVQIGTSRIEANSAKTYIVKGTKVKVVSVKDHYLIVEPIIQA